MRILDYLDYEIPTPWHALVAATIGQHTRREVALIINDYLNTGEVIVTTKGLLRVC